MSEELRLVEPTVALQGAYMSFYREWIDSGENIVPWVVERDPGDFASMVQTLLAESRGEGVPDGWVPSSTYWLLAGERIVGAVNIRHGLTEKLRTSGGHIGYGIRPTARRRGYATRLLALALEQCRGLGIQRALVVCDSDNAASERTIVRNGGVRDEDYVESDGNVIRRFWIDLQ